MSVATETLSLKWWEIILCKVVSKTSETRATLDMYGVDYLMKMYEWMCYEDYIQALQSKDHQMKRKQEATLAQVQKLMPK